MFGLLGCSIGLGRRRAKDACHLALNNSSVIISTRYSAHCPPPEEKNLREYTAVEAVLNRRGGSRVGLGGSYAQVTL